MLKIALNPDIIMSQPQTNLKLSYYKMKGYMICIYLHKLSK